MARTSAMLVMALLVMALLIVAGCAGTLPAASPATTPGPSLSEIALVTPGSTPVSTPTTAPTPATTPVVAATAAPALVATMAPPPTPKPSATPRPKRDDRGCPLRPNLSLRELLDLHRTLLVGGRELEYDGTITVWARNDSYMAGDQIPHYAFLDLEIRPIAIDAGARLELREDGATLTSVTRATRTPFDRYDGSGGLPEYDGPDPRPLDSGATEGRGWIRTPDRAGTWVIAFDFEWQTHCYGGSGLNWVVVRTH